VDTRNISFQQARNRFAEELDNDDGLYVGYEANIAMYLHDRQGDVDYHNKADRDQAAEDILNILFSDMLDR